MLTPKQEAFCIARARPDCHSDADAYRVAYDAGRMKPATVSSRVAELMRDGKITARIKELRDAAAEPIMFEIADILREWVTIATADPSELSRTRHLSCRHCWGEGHAYQWKNPTEYAMAVAAVMDHNAAAEQKRGAKQQDMPDASGGFGYRKLDPPHPKCPECDGEGILDTYLADISSVSPAARKLFAGIKQTANGPEIKLRDQCGALLNLAKYYGMHSDTLRLALPPGTTAIVTSDMPPAEAAKLYATVVSGGK